jgi:hypothetical protein
MDSSGRCPQSMGRTVVPAMSCGRCLRRSAPSQPPHATMVRNSEGAPIPGLGEAPPQQQWHQGSRGGDAEADAGDGRAARDAALPMRYMRQLCRRCKHHRVPPEIPDSSRQTENHARETGVVRAKNGPSRCPRGWCKTPIKPLAIAEVGVRELCRLFCARLPHTRSNSSFDAEDRHRRLSAVTNFRESSYLLKRSHSSSLDGGPHACDLEGI